VIECSRSWPAFEAFYAEHYAFVWRNARRMLADAGDDQVEDLIQDTWIAAYRRFDSFAGECRATTWLFGILRNVARNRARGERRRNRRVTALAVHEHARTPTRDHGNATQLLARSMLESFLRTLDDDKRAVFVMAEIQGETVVAIAAGLGIPVDTAYSRLRAARKLFQEAAAELRAHGESDPPARWRRAET
jgi:RNA polymerase sigma-70 factor (ECF subfamily)